MMNALNILPSYTDYFHLDTATLALNSSTVWIGSCISGLCFGKVCDIWGRIRAMYIATAITILAVILQAASQNVAMFAVSRIIIGFGIGASQIVVPAYLAETLPVKWRTIGLGTFNSLFYIGRSSTCMLLTSV